MSFDQDPKITMMLKRLLTKSSLTYDEWEAFFYLKNVIDVPANSKPYVHSIYIYYDNPMRRFLSTREGLTDMETFFDRSWLETTDNQRNDGEMKTLVRNIKEFDIKHTSYSVITVSKPFAANKGRIVINFTPEYFEKSFNTLRKFQDQTILITDAQGNPIMHSDFSTYMNTATMDYLSQVAVSLSLGSPTTAAFEEDGPHSYIEKGQHITIKPIPRLGWYLITTVPNTSMYGPVRTMTLVTILLSICCVLISTLLAVWMTRKNYRQVNSIISALNSADLKHPIVGSGKRVRDLYELIIHNILESFLQQRYLKIQLSEKKYREEVLELRTLQSQMNPHFLSNTLHSIYWKSVELTRSPNAVSGMIERLADMLEYAVRTTEELVTLEEELLYCRDYINIQRMCHPTRLEIIWESTEGFEAYKVLKLSLQPIIENSIQYGLEEGDVDDLRIKVRFRSDSSCLKVTVLDNGPGILPERLADIESRLTAEEEPAAHVGLTNTFRRLGLKYGSNSQLRIISKPGVGTAVTLFFPQ